MAVSSTGSSFINSYGIKNTGTGGLMSGLDTDSLVDALTAGTRAKIQKQNQDRQLLSWKQTAYRDVATMLREFTNKHLSFGSTSSLRSQSFFQTFKGKSTSDKVSLVGGATTAIGSVTINEIKSLATAQKMTIKEPFTQTLEGEEVLFNNRNYNGQTMQISVNDTSYTVRLDSLSNTDFTQVVDPDFNAGNDPSGAKRFEKALQALVNDAVGMRPAEADEIGDIDGNVPIVTVSMDYSRSTYEGEMAKLTVDSKRSTVKVLQNSEALGLAKNQTNRISTSTKLKDIANFQNVRTEDGIVKFKINGEEITADFEKDSLQSLLDKISNSGANVKASYSAITQQVTFTSTRTGAGNNIDIEDTVGNLMYNMVGARSTSKLTSADLGDVNIGYAGTIDVGSMSLDDLKDKLVAMHESGEKPVFSFMVGGQAMQVGWDGVDAESDWDGKNAAEYLQSSLNNVIKASYPNSGITFKAKVGDDQQVAFSFNVPDNVEVDLVLTDVSGITGAVDLFGELSMGGDNNLGGTPPKTTMADLGLSGTNQQFTINGETIAWSDTDTLEDFIDNVNAKLGPNAMSFLNGKVTINTGADTLTFDDTTGVMEKLFGKSTYDSSGVTTDPSDPDYPVTNTAGTNAVIVLEGGIVLSESSNTFDIDGIVISVNATTDVDDKLPITITSESDSDELVDKIKTFVEEYNTLILKFNTLLQEKGDSSYTPLTDEQKSEMTADQIKTWETEAKKGLLRNDSTIRTIMSELRGVLSNQVEAAGGLALYDIGITTLSMTTSGSVDLTKSGMIEITEEGEKKLRDMIEREPEKVRLLFSHSEYHEDGPDKGKLNEQASGIGWQFERVIDRAVNTSSISSQRGTLVFMAGTEVNTGDNTSTLGNKIDRIDQYVTRLKTQLQTEYSRYWAKFSALETALSRLNSQSSWLSQYSS